MDVEAQVRLFSRRLPLQIKLREIARLLSSLDGKTCLDVGFDSPCMSRQFRLHGGQWHSLISTEAARAEVLQAVGDRVTEFDGTRIPFEDKVFDLVVVSDLLERVPAAGSLIAECHRVLRPTGRLVVDVHNAKRVSVLRPLGRMLKIGEDGKERGRAGYSEAELFQLLKQGFDVHAVRSYSRALSELVDRIADAKAQRIQGPQRNEALLRLYSRTYPLYWLAFQLDALLFFTRGYNLVAAAHRHPWRPRKAPVLGDGRSISEVVLRRIKG